MNIFNHQIKPIIGFKELSHCDGSLKYPQHMFWYAIVNWYLSTGLYKISYG